eukprot:361734-Chlamydomonas_euryale.AAC.3
MSSFLCSLPKPLGRAAQSWFFPSEDSRRHSVAAATCDTPRAAQQHVQSWKLYANVMPYQKFGRRPEVCWWDEGDSLSQMLSKGPPLVRTGRMKELRSLCSTDRAGSVAAPLRQC